MGKHKKKVAKGPRYAAKVKIRLNRKHKDSVFCMLFNKNK